ncbi:MAG: sugar phosphate isomerase/epimerase [Geobacillus sp.]|nr:MAG: sugar phosphate isomerase/epimerase [Geobacillus sp.]
MKRWISTWSIGPNAELAHFQKIKEAGFAGVEIWCEHKRALVYLEYARQCGLEIGMHLPFHDLNFATPDITVWNHTEKVLIEWMKKLREYEGVHATLHGGYAWASEERDEAIEKVKKRLTAMAAIAAELGVELLLENLIAGRLNYSHHIASHFSEWKSLLYRFRLIFRHNYLSNALEHFFWKLSEMLQERNNRFLQLFSIGMKPIGNHALFQPAPNPFDQI